MNPADVTSSGLSLFTVQRIMEHRVTVWADKKRRQRLATDVILAARIRRAQLGAPAVWTTRPAVGRTRP